MSYIDESLVQGETVVHRARVSWWSQFGLVVLGIVLLVVVIGLFFLVAAWVRVHSTEIAITNRRVIAKFGFIRRHTIEMNMDKVESVDVDQSVFGRIFGYGDVLVRGTGVGFEPLHMIESPIELRNAVTAR